MATIPDLINGARRSRGFTLLEVLIAMAVVAIGLTAVMAEASRDLHNTALLRDKTLAHWVAMNKVTEWQLDDNWPAPGVRRGETEMGEQRWYWTVTLSTTDDSDVRRLDVVVSAQRDDGRPLATVLAYLGRPIK